MPHDPAIPLPKGMSILYQRHTSNSMFTAKLFTVAKICNQQRHISDEQRKRHIYTQ